MIERHEIAVLIPAYARPDRLAACLDALAVQDGGPYRVHVVDDGSPASLREVCERHPFVRYHRQENAGPAAARNAGARAARDAGGRILCFTDDDCRPRPGWVRALTAAIREDGTRLVGGRVENALSENAYAEASQSLNDYLYDYFGAEDGTAPFFTSNNMGCTLEAFEAIGGFDESFPLAAAEDRDFGLRWGAGNGPLHYAPDAIVDHAHPLDLKRFWRQHANYGRGACHLRRIMADQEGRDGGFEAARFYAGLVFHPLRRAEPGALRRTALMGLSQVAMVAGYLDERKSGRRGALPTKDT